MFARPDQIVMPRVLAIAQGLLKSVEYRYSDHAFSAYMEAFQTVAALNMGELSLLVPALKLVVLEEFAAACREGAEQSGFAADRSVD